MPALLSRLHVRPRTRAPILGRPVIGGLKALVRTRVPAALLTTGIVAFAVVGAPRLEVNADQLFFFDDDDPVRQARRPAAAAMGDRMARRAR